MLKSRLVTSLVWLATPCQLVMVRTALVAQLMPELSAKVIVPSKSVQRLPPLRLRLSVNAGAGRKQDRPARPPPPKCRKCE